MLGARPVLWGLYFVAAVAGASEDGRAWIPETAGNLITTAPNALVEVAESAPSLQQPVATVGNATITREDLWNWVRANPQYLSVFGSQWGQSVALTGLIEDRLLRHAAIAAFPAKDDMPANIAQARAVRQYKKKYLTPDPKGATTGALQTYYEKNRDHFGIPPMVRVRELFFPAVDEASMNEAWVQGDVVHKKIIGGQSIESFADRFAPDYPSQKKGGDRGYISLTDRPELARVTASMDLGDISEPVQLPTGVAIIQLLGRRDAVPAAYEDVQDIVRRHFIRAEQQSLKREFFTSESKRQGVRILLPEYRQAWPEERLSSSMESL